jgi:hypothetical protein
VGLSLKYSGVCLDIKGVFKYPINPFGYFDFNLLINSFLRVGSLACLAFTSFSKLSFIS